MRQYRQHHTREEVRAMSEAEQLKLMKSLLRTYEEHSAAEGYLVAFCYKKHWYFLEVEKLRAEWCYFAFASGSHKTKVNLSMNNAQMKALVDSGKCVELDPSFLSLHKCKGWAFEKYVTETLCGGEWEQDNVPFYVQGDVVMNGKQMQVKVNGAQVVFEQTLVYRSWMKMAK